MRFRTTLTTTAVRGIVVTSLVFTTSIACGGSSDDEPVASVVDSESTDSSGASDDDSIDDDSQSSDTEPDERSDDEPDESTVDLEWDECAVNVECATIEVPFDYDDPTLGAFRLPVVRHLALDPDARVGSLLVNPGGPGAGAVDMAYGAGDWFSDDVLDRFDIVAWDPRGTGGSIPSIDCADSMDPLYGLDPSPDDATERDALVVAAGDYASRCVESSSGILDYVGTEASARDMDAIRRALGEDTISYLGFSYGTVLGSVWVTLFPDTVRAAVLDAAVDPELGYLDGLVDQARGFEESLYAFLADCDERGCGFMRDGESARDAIETILTSLESDPLPNTGGRPDTGPGVAAVGIANALYGSYAWPYLEDALTAVREGDGGLLLAEYDMYFGGWDDGHNDDFIDAYFGIFCLNRDHAVTVDEVFGVRDELTTVAPLLGEGWLTEMLVCAQWPLPARPIPMVSAGTDEPVLVVGSTGDAATPIEGTRNMARVLGNAMLLEVDSDDHTSYGSNACATRIIDEYLIDLRRVSEGQAC